jgi:hypothetical protein
MTPLMKFTRSLSLFAFARLLMNCCSALRLTGGRKCENVAADGEQNKLHGFSSAETRTVEYGLELRHKLEGNSSICFVVRGAEFFKKQTSPFSTKQYQAECVL